MSTRVYRARSAFATYRSLNDQEKVVVAVPEHTAGRSTSAARELDYVYVREIRSPGVRSTFVRLVRPGGPTPATTFDAECTVDVDGDGNVIGVTVHQYASDGRVW